MTTFKQLFESEQSHEKHLKSRGWVSDDSGENWTHADHKNHSIEVRDGGFTHWKSLKHEDETVGSGDSREIDSHLRQFHREKPPRGSVFHTSYDPIDEVSSRPMWFSRSSKHADAYHENSVEQASEAHTYSAKISPKANIAHHASDEFAEVLKRNKVDPDDYVGDLASNPSHSEIMRHPGTKALVKAGYHGVTHLDYDPRDSNKDIETTLVFDPSKHVTNWSKYR